ncbi:MAG: type II toxin-antitoxin system Phd/YefM family antitoxin [Acidobacteriia bacterium]|nr:type II toxin-antitoxin system Phd/YefM family antitoxin [Terriglobia bacterium]
MSVLNVHDGKTHLSKLLVRVEEGEEIAIAKAGKPVAKLTSVKAQQARVPGIDAGLVWISPDFDKFSEEDDRDWYGKGIFPASKK